MNCCFRLVKALLSFCLCGWLCLFCVAQVFDLCTGGELFDEINRLAYFTEYDAVRLVK